MMETGQRYAQNEQEGDLEEYQQQSSFKKIEELENHGVNKTDIIKLKAGGYHTIEAVSSSGLLCIDLVLPAHVFSDCTWLNAEVG